ncbi:MAG: RNA polymerase sigma factor, partial [Actinomycetota bacterium]|nr:RNA polymerase sigma factor [Actinomycetota bacterium]
GDCVALSKVLREQYKRVFAVCLRMMGSRTAAEDQTQEALLRIARGLSSFEGKSAFGTWCHRVATTTCLDELRRQRRRPTTTTLTNTDGSDVEPVDDVEITAGIEWSDVRDDIREALDALPVDFARAVVLRDVLELGYQEIADLTGVATGTVKSRISRGRALLAEQLGGNRNGDIERLTNGDNE